MGRRKNRNEAQLDEGLAGFAFDDSGNLVPTGGVNGEPDVEGEPASEVSSVVLNEDSSFDPDPEPHLDPRTTEPEHQEQRHNWEKRAKDAQRALSKKDLELAELRRKLEAVEAAKSTPAPEPDDDDIIASEYPELDQALRKRLDKVKSLSESRLAEIEQRNAAESAAEAREFFMDGVRAVHRDAEAILTNPKFGEWLDAQRISVQRVMRETFDGGYEPDDVIEVLTKFKNANGRTTPQVPPGLGKKTLASGGSPSSTPTAGAPSDIFSFQETMQDDSFLDRNVRKFKDPARRNAFLEKYEKSVHYWGSRVANR